MDKSIWRQCKRKNRYRDEHAANYYRKKFEQARGQKLDYYWCSYYNGYVLLSMLSVIAVVPCVAGVIMFSALFWALVDGSGRGDNSNSNPYPISQK